MHHHLLKDEAYLSAWPTSQIARQHRGGKERRVQATVRRSRGEDTRSVLDEICRRGAAKTLCCALGFADHAVAF